MKTILYILLLIQRLIHVAMMSLLQEALKQGHNVTYFVAGDGEEFYLKTS